MNHHIHNKKKASGIPGTTSRFVNEANTQGACLNPYQSETPSSILRPSLESELLAVRSEQRERGSETQDLKTQEAEGEIDDC